MSTPKQNYRAATYDEIRSAVEGKDGRPVFAVLERERGVLIDWNMTAEMALESIQNFERSDRNHNRYVPDYYEIGIAISDEI